MRVSVRLPLLLIVLLLGAVLVSGCTVLDRLSPRGDLTGPGQRAAEFLRPQPFGSILVEVDFVGGSEPEARALGLLEQRLEAASQKAVDVTRTSGVPGKGSAHRYTLDEIGELEGAHRGAFAGDGRAVLYVLYLDGAFERDTGDTKTLAAAYRGSSVVVFKANLREASRSGALDLTKPPLPEVEEAVLVHEIGHILGLVDLGAPMTRPHEDPQHPGHSANTESVMYYAVENTLIGPILGQTPPDDFDADDKADLRAVREGR